MLTSRSWRHAPLAALLGAAALAGCGVGTGEAPRGVSLLVTADFGQVELAAPSPPKVAGEDTVLRLLERNTTVKTKFGGGFVSEIAGRSGGTDGVQSTDWFFLLNGVLSERGAAGFKLTGGEQIWWDLHRWDHAQASVVVGQFPEPMRSGSAGRYRGAWLVCRGAAGGCKIADRQLGAAGITVSTQAASEGRMHTEVVVGPWREIRGLLPEIAAIARGPKVSGVFATLDPGGAVTALDDGGKPVATPPGTGLIAAVKRSGGPPVWVITGPDEAAVRRAARQLTPAALARRFAVAATPTGPQPLPAAGGSAQ